MKLSVYSLACPEYTFQETAAKLAELKVPAVEWRVAQVAKEVAFNPLDPARFWSANRSTIPVQGLEQAARDVAKITADHGLEVSFLAGGPSPGELDMIRRQMAAAQILGAPAIRVGSGGAEARDPSAAFDEARKSWDAVEKLAGETGVKAVVETHHFTIVPSASAARRFLEGRDPKHVGLLYDPGNMVWEGFERPQYGLSLIRPWLAHVHVKNARPWVEGADEFRRLRYGYRWCSLRAGAVDWVVVVKALRAAGYTGYLSLEDFNPETQAEEKLRDFAGLFKDILWQA